MNLNGRLSGKRVHFQSKEARVEKIIMRLIGKYFNDGVSEVRPPSKKIDQRYREHK